MTTVDTTSAVTDVVHTYLDRLSAADVEGIVGLFTDDAVVLPPEMAVCCGRAALAELYRGALAAVAMEYTLEEVVDVANWGDTAAICTTTTGGNTVHATGERTAAQYRELFVLRRVADDWRIIRYMFQPKP